MDEFVGRSANPKKSATQPPVYLRGKMKEMGKSQRLSESIKYKVDMKEKTNITWVFHSKRIEMTCNKSKKNES